MSVNEGKKRRPGVWLDLDHAIKREMEIHAGCQNFANEAGWDLILDPVMDARRFGKFMSDLKARICRLCKAGASVRTWMPGGLR